MICDFLSLLALFREICHQETSMNLQIELKDIRMFGKYRHIVLKGRSNF